MDEIALPLFYLLPKVQDYRYFKNVIDLGGINSPREGHFFTLCKIIILQYCIVCLLRFQTQQAYLKLKKIVQKTWYVSYYKLLDQSVSKQWFIPPKSMTFLKYL
jgi:hypothetical protein